MVQKWSISETGVEENCWEEVTSIFCKICQEFYANNNTDLNKLNGAVKQVVLNWISGSKTIKKNNVLDHLIANHYQLVVQILKNVQLKNLKALKLPKGRNYPWSLQHRLV